MMKNKEKAVTVLTKGIEFFFKKNKVTYLKGTGSITGTNQISIKSSQKRLGHTANDLNLIRLST